MADAMPLLPDSMSESARHDVLIIGGGPAGATCAILLARAGLDVLVLEKSRFPRFRIGESLLPRNFPILQELGLQDAVQSVPRVAKLGVEFAMGDGHHVSFGFADGLIPGSPTFNVERAAFDLMLLDHARAAGATVREETGVRRIVRLAENDAVVTTDAGDTIAARCLLDCSGQGSVVGRHLGIRRNFADENFQKVAYFEHFENVFRHEGERGGYPLIVTCQEAWFWIIPIDASRTSVGMVMDAGLAKETGAPATEMLAWGIARCPAVRERMLNATGPETNQIVANFSYACRPYAGPGYFLVGDAATFLDPIFSSGVTLAMIGAQQAAGNVIELLTGRRTAAGARRDYIRAIERGSGVFYRLIEQFYTHSFRELFLNGRGPLQVHNAVLSVLAGQIFPKLPWSLRWRLWLFDLLQQVNRVVQLVPRKQRFSLFAQEAVPEEICQEGEQRR